METKLIHFSDVTFYKKTLFCFCIASFLQFLTYQLFTLAKLGSSAVCFALAQTVVILLVAPYIAALSAKLDKKSLLNSHLLLLSPIHIGRSLLVRLVRSQVVLMCWIVVSTVFAILMFSMPIIIALKLMVLLGIFSITVGAIGMCLTQAFKDEIFGTVCTYSILCVFIGSAFLLMPIERYIDNLRPVIQPVLHLNPLIAVCNIFDGLDIFRIPLLYAITPITDYDYSYPSWYINVFWQLVIGTCCFLWTWRMRRSSNITAIYYG